MFNSACGRHRHRLRPNVKKKKMAPAILLFSSNLHINSNIAGGTFPLLIVLVLISACVYWRPSWTPKTQPVGSSAATWLSFWFSTRLLIPKKVNGVVRTMPFILNYWDYLITFDVFSRRKKPLLLNNFFARRITVSSRSTFPPGDLT